MEGKIDKISSNSVALAGEFAVLSQLLLRGFVASPTLGQTKSMDILVSDPNSDKMFKVEVKTSFANQPSRSTLFGYTLSWIMTQKHESIIQDNLFYAFVNIGKPANVFRFFIVPSGVVAEYVETAHRFWLASNSALKDTPIREFRIGLEDNYAIKTPLAKDYENNWVF